jgi:hypothetical protein
MPKMKQEICLEQFEPESRALIAIRRGFRGLQGNGGLLSP